jgi:hypothetical protein
MSIHAMILIFVFSILLWIYAAIGFLHVHF